MDKILMHQIVLWMAMIVIPLFSLLYIRDVFRPKRKSNGKLQWWNLILSIYMAGWMGYITVTIAPAFAHYVMHVDMVTPPKIYVVADIIFLVFMAAFITGNIWFLPKRPGVKEFWQRGNKLCDQ